MESHLIIAETIKKLKVDYLVDNANYQTNLNTHVVNVLDTLQERIINAEGFKFTSEFSNLPKSKQYSEGEQVKFGFDKNNLVIV